MRQIFLLILFVVIGQWLVKAVRRAQPRPGSQDQSTRSGQGGQSSQSGQGAWRTPNSAANGSQRQGALPEPMVRCAECGVHAPRSESVTTGAQSFCSHEHARKYAARAATGQDRAAR
jgi:uncharacterized protein